jgi:hypothetical protein
MEHTWQQFVEQYEQWIWDTWPTAATVDEINRELREINETRTQTSN